MNYIAIFFFIFAFFYLGFFFWILERYYVKNKEDGLFTLWGMMAKKFRQYWREFLIFFALFFSGSFALIYVFIEDLFVGLVLFVFVYFPIMYIIYWRFMYPKSMIIKNKAEKEVEKY